MCIDSDFLGMRKVTVPCTCSYLLVINIALPLSSNKTRSQNSLPSGFHRRQPARTPVPIFQPAPSLTNQTCKYRPTGAPVRRLTVVLINGRIVRRQLHRLDEPALCLLHPTLASAQKQPSSVIATLPSDAGTAARR